MVDFSKAFDTVDHATVIRKVNSLELPPSIKAWITSFLRDRSQMVKINGQLSDVVGINRGIVQGSAIGPYLFIIMIADLVPLDIINMYIKYADDLTILVPEHSPTGVADEYCHTSGYAKDNKLTINAKKTKEQIFYRSSCSRRKNPISPSVSNIELIDCCKLLGVFIDSSLSFYKHVNELLTVCSRRFYLLKLCRSRGMPIDALHLLYQLIIVNRIAYCIPAWGGFIKSTDVDRLNKLFRRAKRYGYTHTVYDLKGLLHHYDYNFLQ